MSEFQSSVPATRQLLDQLPPVPTVHEDQSFIGLAPQGNITYAEFRNSTFRDVTLRGVLDHVRFVRCRFDKVEWIAGPLVDVKWEDCLFADTQWTGCRLSHPLFDGGTASRIGFHACEVDFATIHGATWSDAEFLRSRVVQWVASSANVSGLRFVAGKVQDVTWAECAIRHLHMESMDMQRFTCALGDCTGVRVMNCSGSGNRWIACILEDMRFESVKYAQCAWSKSEWRGGAFVGCELHLPSYDGSVLANVRWIDSPCTRPMFDDATMADCSLHRQHMPGMSLRGARLDCVDLRALHAPGLDARGATLSGVKMTGADFSHALLDGQPKQAWAGAKVNGARFDEPADVRDDQWWARHSPGPKENKAGHGN